MKIIYVLNHYLPLQVAGTEVYVAALCREMMLLGHTVKVVIPNYASDTMYRYTFEDTEVLAYAEPSLPDRATRMGNEAPKGIQNFIDLIVSEAPDLVHIHELAGSNGIGLFHLKELRALKLQTVITFHLARYTCKTGTLMHLNKNLCDGVMIPQKCSNCWLHGKGLNVVARSFVSVARFAIESAGYDSMKMQSKIGTALSLPALIEKQKSDLLEMQRSIGAVITLTDWYRDILIKNGFADNNLHTIKQALPYKPGAPIYKKEQEKELRLIYVGRITAIKGVLGLIECVKNIGNKNILLDVYGKSGDDEYYSKCMLAAKGESNIEVKGYIDPEKVVETISRYDVLCIPSEVTEMAPLVVLEAFAAGVPVLASNNYGNAAAITEGVNGWLYSFKNGAELHNKIIYLNNNRKEIEKAALQNSTPRNFSLVAKEHERIYNNILPVNK